MINRRCKDNVGLPVELIAGGKFFARQDVHLRHYFYLARVKAAASNAQSNFKAISEETFL